MLEILAIAWLCNLNSKNAVSRGRKPGLFILLTILCWFGGEVIGGVIGAILELDIAILFLALGFGILGGVVSFLIAKNCKPGDYVPQEKKTASPKVMGITPQYCENCGAKLDEGSAFCYNCGAKVSMSQPTVQTVPEIHEHEEKTPHSCSKAPYLLGFSAMIMWCLLFGLHFIEGFPLMYDHNGSIMLAYTCLACAAYLIRKKGLQNVCGIILSVFFALSNVINPVMNMMNLKNINFFRFSDLGEYSGYGRGVLQTLLIIAAVYGTALLLQKLFENKGKDTNILFPVILTGAVLVVRSFFDIGTLFNAIINGYSSLILVILRSGFYVAATLLTVLFTLSYMEKLPNKGGKNRVLGIIWCVLCLIANDTNAVLGVVQTVTGETVTTSYAFMISIALMAAFIFLLAKGKYAFSLVVVFQVLYCINQWMRVVSMPFFDAFFLLSSFAPIANIFLTWLLVIREKKAVPQTVAAAAVPGKSSFEKNNIGARQETAAQKAVVNTVPEKRFFERDNMGTRQETMQQALAYWMGTRPGLKVKPPFALYDFSSAENAEKALLELPFIHKAADSGKLICDRIMTFGYYAVTENGVPNGEYEAIIEGTDLTLAEFRQAEAVFESYGGKRKNHAEPEATVRNNASVGDPSKVKYSETVKGNDGVSIYEVYTGPDKASAIAFLKGKIVTKSLYYVVVDTPEGSFGRDINGFYQE